MSEKPFSTVTDQVTERLRHGMREGWWRGTLPGRKRLAEELGCSQWTIEEATQRLTREGVLVSQGAGRRQRIALSEVGQKARNLRVMILLYEASDRAEAYMLELVHRLQDAGHAPSFAERTMHDLGMDVTRITRFVQSTEADAWVVLAGSSDVLEWFSSQDFPAFALFGRNRRHPIASASLQKPEALAELVDQLVDLGHQRIVFLAREERRKPTPGLVEETVLARLRERGIPTGPYNLPDWGDSPVEFHSILDSLFARTPPTALIVDQPSLCVALLQHLSQLGITAPRDVSIACSDQSDSLDWCVPAVTQVAWNSRTIINRVVRWADLVSRGKEDRRKSFSKARLIVGGTIGPVPRGS